MALKKIKILQVGLDTHLGGIETYLFKITSHIDRNRFQFDFLAFDDEKPCFYDELTELGCNFKFVRGRRHSFFGNIRDVRELIKKQQYDIIHCHLNSLSYITPVLEGIKFGAKVIVHSRNAGSAEGSSSSFFCRINKYILPYSKVTMVAVSDKAGEWMFGKDRNVIILNNGIDTKSFAFSNTIRIEARKELSIHQDSEVIVHVGAFRPQKNHTFLIDIFKAYSSSHPDALLLLVGEGELKGDIEEKVKLLGLSNKVKFLGKRLDLHRILSASDKFLFPSLYEGFPNALIEAEASGLRCIVSDEITEQACFEDCIRVPLSSSVDEWVKALSSAPLEHREGYAKLIEDKGFGIEGEIAKLEELYLSQMESK